MCVGSRIFIKLMVIIFYVMLLLGNVRACASSRFKPETKMAGEDTTGNH